ncbi:ankyrin repeat domain-containing protein [bacterium]|nr:ankyrin repeat domain-containing protein [bacterium]MDC0319372.1 ankyrin repeat domain-containing protein [Verrucomicrobiota bacterium]
MKHILLTTIAAVVLVGCGQNIHQASWTGNIEAVKQAIADGADLNAKNEKGETPLHIAAVLAAMKSLSYCQGCRCECEGWDWPQNDC